MKLCARNVPRARSLTLFALSAGGLVGLYRCSSWDCNECTAPAECVASCPPDQEFDGCFCIGGEAGIDAGDASNDADGTVE